jgi:hypothetical protein
MKKEINEKIIKITGSANIEKQLEQDHDYAVGVNANCSKTELRSNQDGSQDLIYTLKMLGEVSLEDLGEKTRKAKISGKAKGTYSQKWRWIVENYPEDYDKFMAKMLRHPDKIIEFVNNIVEN